VCYQLQQITLCKKVVTLGLFKTWQEYDVQKPNQQPPLTQPNWRLAENKYSKSVTTSSSIGMG
jgi:hypothetical protein